MKGARRRGDRQANGQTGAAGGAQHYRATTKAAVQAPAQTERLASPPGSSYRVLTRPDGGKQQNFSWQPDALVE